jgi:hypothetical protein
MWIHAEPRILNIEFRPFFTFPAFPFSSTYFFPVLRIRIRMDPHDFGLPDPHPESAFHMRIPDADADPD